MTYRLGIDIGGSHTVWATVSRDGDGPQSVDGATVESVVALADGRLVAGADVSNAVAATLQHITKGFVDRLGDASPLIVGGTPYGAESLVARLVVSVVDEARTRLGQEPAAVVLVHDDGLDDYRTGLLAEAARVAGIPLAKLVMVARGDAEAATADGALRFPAALAAAVGASLLGWARLPDLVANVADAGASVHMGAAVGGVALGTGGAALGASALAGGSGTAAVAGPAGVSLASVGPSGSPLTSLAGPTGSPLTSVTGPTGTPLKPPGGTGKFLRNLLSTPKAIAVAATTAVAVAVATVAITAPDDAVTSVDTAVTEVGSGAPAPAADLSECVVGTWTVSNESYEARFTNVFAASGLAVAVSGSVVIVIAADGVWTISHNDWAVSLTSAGLQIEMIGTGVDTGQGDFRDDGTFTFTDIAVGVTFDVSAMADGVPVAVPASATSPPRVTFGSGTYTCEGDLMRVGTDTEFVLAMSRTG